MNGYEIILAVYMILALYGCIVGGILTAFETENETNILVCAFYLQIAICEKLEGEINYAGIVIALAVMTLFLLPCNILILIIKTLVLACNLFWAVFKRVFRKKPAKGGGEDG